MNAPRKQHRYLYLIVAICAVGVAISGFTDDADMRTVKRTQEWYKKQITIFGNKIDILAAACEGLTNDQHSIQALQAAFNAARAEYKRMEFLVGFFDSYAASKINAPPLLKVDESTRMRLVIQPEGFQVIEELAFGENPANNKEELLRLAKRLQLRQKKMAEFAKRTQMQDRYIIEATRNQMLRIMFLGVTGFDSPVALRSLPEAEFSIIGIEEVLGFYAPMLRERSPALQSELGSLLAATKKYLHTSNDFDSFNRLEFIREYGDPLYALLLHVHNALSVPTFAEVTNLNRAVRYETESIFSPDAFNPEYYSPDYFEKLNPKRAELGKILFFDPVLSSSVSKSCASCHNPDMAFTDGRATSMGLGAHELQRNAPTLLNVVFQGSFFHDARAEDVEHQIESVLLNHAEMHATFEGMIARLNKSPEYRNLFNNAYIGTRDTAITKYGIIKAIADYMRTVVAFNSRFDRYMRGENNAMNIEERNGFNHYMGKAGCGTCHFAPLFNGSAPPYYTESEIEVVGTPATPDTVHPALSPDLGRFNVFGDDIHRNGFKTPTIRNVGLTAPYMHNGVYKTLEEVVDFYNRGGGVGLGLDVPNQTLPSATLNLTQQEKHELIAFMKTLTDTTGTTSRPARLPSFPNNPELNSRTVADRY